MSLWVAWPGHWLWYKGFTSATGATRADKVMMERKKFPWRKIKLNAALTTLNGLNRLNRLNRLD